MTNNISTAIIKRMSSPDVATPNKNILEIERQISVVLADAKGSPSVVLADNLGNPPTRFELLKAGMWRTPYHGDIMITPTDGEAYIENFKAGHGVSGNNMGKLPINYAHESSGKAAAWFVPEFDGETLWAAQVEWTPAAIKAIKDGEWKCISAEFCPAGRGGWLNPLDDQCYIENVLTGAALTNIPLFSQLEPVMASATFGKKDDNRGVILIASENKEPQKMELKLEDVRVKNADALSDDEKTFLATNKEQLTADEKTKFGFEVAADVKAEDKPADSAVVDASTQGIDPAVVASIKSGESVVVEASVLASMKEQTDAYAKEKASQKVMAHVSRGAIKADTAEDWTNRVLADATLETALSALPSNEALGAEVGSDTAAISASAVEEVRTKAKEMVTADTSMQIGEAISKVLRENKELADRYNNETNN